MYLKGTSSTINRNNVVVCKEESYLNFSQPKWLALSLYLGIDHSEDVM